MTSDSPEERPSAKEILDGDTGLFEIQDASKMILSLRLQLVAKDTALRAQEVRIKEQDARIRHLEAELAAARSRNPSF
jgi:hypothetical protein